MTKATYICRGAKKKVVINLFYFYFYFILFLFFIYFFLRAFFGRFVTRGVQKHEKTFFSKKSIGSSQEMRLFFPPFFSPSVVLFDFFLSRFWAFRDKGSSKTP
jgi:hypothetical protein